MLSKHESWCLKGTMNPQNLGILGVFHLLLKINQLKFVLLENRSYLCRELIMKSMRFILDMDGVLADFIESALRELNTVYNKNVSVKEYARDFGKWEICDYYGIPEEDFWYIVNNTPDFWLNIKPYPWTKSLYNKLSKLGEVTVVSSPSASPTSVLQKLLWLKKHLDISPGNCFIGGRKYLMAGNGILIDDYHVNIDKFERAGGHGILVPSNWNTEIIDLAVVWEPIEEYLTKKF